MAIASNIFKQLLYVPEGTIIGTVDPDNLPQSSGTFTTSAAAKLGDDEITVGVVGGTAGVLNIGTKITFTGTGGDAGANAYYLTTPVTITVGASTIQLVLDRPLVKGIDSGCVLVQQYAAPISRANQPRALRRVSSNITAKYETYASNEVRSDQQIADYRVGSKSIDGTLSCELSSKTYEDFFAALLRKNFYSPVLQTFASITAAPAADNASAVIGGGMINANSLILTFGSGDKGATNGDSGSTSTDKFTGIKIGDVISLTPTGTTSATITNEYVTASTASASWATVPLLVVNKNTINLTLTLVAANNPNTTTFGAGSIVTSTIQVLGRKSFIPLTNHKQKSFQFEHYYKDLSDGTENTSGKPISELFTGCRITQGAIKLPTSGVATCDFTVMGIGSKLPKDSIPMWNATSTPATFVNTKSMMETLSEDNIKTSAIDAVYSSAVGNIYFTIGTQVYKADAITSFDFSINGNGASLKVVGSQTSPDVTLGKIQVSGNMSVYFKDNILYDAFLTSADMSFIAYFSESIANKNETSFMNFVMPRVKLGGATKDDAQSIVMSVPFQALVGAGNNGFEATTLQMQDYSQIA